jgi:uncharacterized protein YkwD
VAAEGEEGARKFPIKNILIGLGGLVFTCLLLYFAIAFLFGGGTWQEYTSKDGGFTVLMPGSPTPQAKSSPGIHNATNFQEVSLPLGSSTYSVHYYDLPHRPINEYLVCTNSMHRLIGEKSGKLSHELPTASGNFQGKEFVIELPSSNQMVARRVYVANARIYWVTAQFPKTDGFPPEVQRFFDSFKITQAPPMPAGTLASLNANQPAPAVPFSTKGRPIEDTPAEPPVTKGNPKGGFTMSEEEQLMVEAINRLRNSEKVGQVTPDQRLFGTARAEAATEARKGSGKSSDYGYLRYSRLSLPGRDETPQQILDRFAASKSNRNRLADEELHDIGVGVSSANGITYYVIIMGGNPR